MAAEKIFTDGPCTACETDRFFSHRADAGKAGRMMSVIGIVGDEGRERGRLVGDRLLRNSVTLPTCG